MVQHDVGTIATPNGIGLHFVDVAQPEAQVADDNIVGVDCHIIAFQTDTVARGCLTGYGHVSIFDAYATAHIDDARYLEQDGALA